MVGTSVFMLAVVGGMIGPPEWSWIRVTLLSVAGFGLFVVATVPEHFLQEHLWKHAIVQHVPRLFAWTLGSLAIIVALDQYVQVDSFVRNNRWLVLGVASALGLVPESGPHLLFVTLYDHGALPISVLAASSIVQDGHGMLPLLAHSWRDFLKVKSINLLVGLAVGAFLLSRGF